MVNGLDYFLLWLNWIAQPALVWIALVEPWQPALFHCCVLFDVLDNNLDLFTFRRADSSMNNNDDITKELSC